MALALALGTFVSTMLGGLLALHRRDQLALIMAAASGILVAAALLDLLPEALNLAGQGGFDHVALAALAGFLAFFALDWVVHLTASGHTDDQAGPVFGSLAALGLTVHSFLDGFAIGSAFQASEAAGVLVAVAVLTHDFGDGVSTVGVVLGARGRLRTSLLWLIADALAPLVGAVAALSLTLSPTMLGPLLGFFAGSFLFIGAAHLLPESQPECTESTRFSAFVGGALLVVLATQVFAR